MAADKKKYVVGYGKPPIATQFKPGQSGNGKGRRKGTKNFKTALDKELNTRVPVTENGRRKTITKREAVAKQLVNKAAAGDPRCIPILLGEARQFEQQGGDSAPYSVLDTPEDQLVMEAVVNRIRETDPAPSSSLTPSPMSTPTPSDPDTEDK